MDIRRFRSPVFFRHVSLYLLFSVCAVLLFIPAYWQGLDAIQERSASLIAKTQQRSGHLLEESTQDVLLLNTLMQSTLYYEVKKSADPDFTPQKYYKLRELQEQFGKQASSVNYALDILIVFDRNDKVISKNRVYHSAEECFGTLFRLDGYTAQAALETLRAAPQGKHFLPATQVSIDGGAWQDCIVLTARLFGDSATVVAVYAMKDIETLFNLPTYPENTCFSLFLEGEMAETLSEKEAQALPGMPVWQQTIDGAPYTMIGQTLESLNLRVVTGIPNDYFDSQLEPIRRLLWTYASVAVFLALVLAVVGALYAYLPLRRLIRGNLGRLAGPREGKNEYRYLKDAIEYMDTENMTLHSSLSEMQRSMAENLFLRLIHGLVYTAEDADMAAILLPMLAKPCLVVLITQSSEGDGPEGLLEAVKQITQGEYIVTMTKWNQYAALVPQAVACEFRTRAERILSMRGGLPGGISVGISAPVHDPSALRAALHQAQIALSNQEDMEIAVYTPMGDQSENTLVDFTKMQRLYDQVLVGNIQEITEEFAAFRAKLYAPSMQADDIGHLFSLLRNVTQMAMQALGVEDLELPSHRRVDNPIEQLDAWQAILVQLSTRSHAQYKERKENTADQMVTHLREHFSDSSLYAASLADTFGMSEKSVYRLIRQKTGRSFNEYLEALRMDYAAARLRGSDDAISSIAESSGFHSTNSFYKAFKKHFGVAPSQYREMRQGRE